MYNCVLIEKYIHKSFYHKLCECIFLSIHNHTLSIFDFYQNIFILTMESLRTTRQTDTKRRKKIMFNNSNNAISKEKSNINKRIEAHTSGLVSKKIKLTHEHGINQDNNTINEENNMDNDGKNDVEEHVDNNEVIIEISKEEQLFNIQQRILNHKKTDSKTLDRKSVV